MDFKNSKNCHIKTIDKIDFYFSYNTIVAYKIPEIDSVICCKNVWSRTTGVHISTIEPDASKRIPYERFHDQLANIRETRKVLKELKEA